MTEDSKPKAMSSAVSDTKNWYDRKIWECQEHPGCLVSIPCECVNCTKYAEMLGIKLRERSNQQNDRQGRNRRHSSPDIQIQ